MFKLSFPDTSKEDINRSAAVAKVVELTNLRMTKGEFGPTKETTPTDRKNLTALPPYQFEFSSKFNEKENTLDVSIVIRGRDIHNATGEGAGAGGLRVDAGFLLTYQLMVEPPPEDLRGGFFSAFSKVNGLINIWPYYREFAHEAAQRMGFPNVVVPVLRVEPKASESESKISAPKKKSPAVSARKSKSRG